MILYLVIDNSSNRFKPYADQYTLWESFPEAMAHAKACGYGKGMEWVDLGVPEVGMLMRTQCGDSDVSIIPVKVKQ